MKIGVFDSGLGGLLVCRGITERLPEYDYVYLGDTLRVPYGNRSQEVIYEFVREAVDWLFSEGCLIVILACNTASAEALCRIQQQYLPATYPDRRVLGVIIPTVEAVGNSAVTGVLATRSTVASGAYAKELAKLNDQVRMVQEAAPLLVPLIENGGERFAPDIASSYVQPLLEEGIDTLILGCTHYSAYKNLIRELVPGVRVICQDEVVPDSLADYLARHPELARKLGKHGARRYALTEITDWAGDAGKDFGGQEISFEAVQLKNDERSSL